MLQLEIEKGMINPVNSVKVTCKTGKVGDVITIKKDILVGREPTVDLRIAEVYSFASRKHFTLTHTLFGGWSITDQKSTYGTFLQRGESDPKKLVPFEQTKLEAEDLISIVVDGHAIELRVLNT